MPAPHEDLLALRSEFPILERTTYLINNSLVLLRQAEPESIDYEIFRNAVVKGFELTLEPAGKLLRKILKIYTGSPRAGSHVAGETGACRLLTCGRTTWRRCIACSRPMFPRPKSGLTAAGSPARPMTAATWISWSVIRRT